MQSGAPKPRNSWHQPYLSSILTSFFVVWHFLQNKRISFIFPYFVLALFPPFSPFLPHLPFLFCLIPFLHSFLPSFFLSLIWIRKIVSMNKTSIRISFGKVEIMAICALSQRSWSDKATYQLIVKQNGNKWIIAPAHLSQKYCQEWVMHADLESPGEISQAILLRKWRTESL